MNFEQILYSFKIDFKTLDEKLCCCFEANKLIHSKIFASAVIFKYALVQGSQTRGPRISKPEKSVNFSIIWDLFKFFCDPQKLFSIKLRPAEHYSFGMWSSDQFEFETLALVYLLTDKKSTNVAG